MIGHCKIDMNCEVISAYTQQYLCYTVEPLLSAVLGRTTTKCWSQKPQIIEI